MYRVVILLSLLFLCGCFTHYPTHIDGVSSDINESKAQGLFVALMYVSPNPYKINDSLIINVKEAWIEKKQNDGQFIYQLGVNFENDSFCNMCELSSKHKLEMGESEYNELQLSSSSSFVSYLRTLPVDSLRYLFKIPGTGGQKDTALGYFVVKRRYHP